MGRLGFYYNMNTCLGCKVCQMACKEVHGLALGEFFRRAEMESAGEGAGKVYFPYSGNCLHCADPACVKACPTGAMYKAEDGTVAHDDNICIACGACMWNCPYGAVSFSTKKGVAQKCEACADRRAEGRDPVCVEACPTKCLRFGDLDEIAKETGAEYVELPIHPSKDMTDPSLIVKLPKSLKGGK